MDVLKAARELGKAIQATDEYKDYVASKEANDKDEALQKQIGEFNLIRQKLQMEMSKPESDKDNAKVSAYNADLQRVYGEIMGNVNMAQFTVVKGAMDKMLQQVNGIISLCCEGEDPDTCEFHDCGGDCGSCGGCH